MSKSLTLDTLYGELAVSTTNLGKLCITIDNGKDNGNIEAAQLYLDKEDTEKLTLFMIDLIPDIDMQELNSKSLTELHYLNELVKDAIELKD
jgi:hypothetical protein